MADDDDRVGFVVDAGELESGRYGTWHRRVVVFVFGHEVAGRANQKVGARLGLQQARGDNATVNARDND